MEGEPDRAIGRKARFPEPVHDLDVHVLVEGPGQAVARATEVPASGRPHPGGS